MKEKLTVALLKEAEDGSMASNEVHTFSRQEAIRKMCDAYFKAKDKGLMESERVVAALNALLEE